MKQIHPNINYQHSKSFYLTRFAMLAQFNKTSAYEYQANLDDPIKMNTNFIIIAGLISLATDYVNLFYSYLLPKESLLMNTESSYLILRAILISFNMVFISLWLIFIKKSYHILSVLTEIAYILLSSGIFIHGAVARFSNLDYISCKTSRYEYIFIGLSICARVTSANIFVRYGLLKLLYCFSMVLTLLILGIIREIEDPLYLYGKGLISLIYLSFLVFLIERIKLKTFEGKYILEQSDKVFQEIMSHIPENILIIGKNGKLKYANIHFKNYFKINDEKLFSLDQLYNIKQIRQQCQHQSQSYSNSTSKINKLNKIPIDLDFSSETPAYINEQQKYETLIELIECLLNDSKYVSNLDKLFTFHGTYEGYNNSDNTMESLRSFEIKIKPSIIQGEPYLIIILRDITEREIIAFLEENNNYKKDLLASFSHELRTPLNSQINYLEAAINDSALDNRIKLSYLRPALQSSKLLKHIINDILDLSSINTNNIALEVDHLSLESTLVQCMELIELQASRKNIKLELEIDPKIPHIVNTDHNKVSQIVVNLLSNSLKFTQENGKIQIIVNFNNPNITITIIDNGIGMSDDEKIRLRQRLDNSIKYKKINKKADGIGIGLTISHILAKLLGPKSNDDNNDIGIVFESEKHSGAKFSFRILNMPEETLENNQIELESKFNGSFENEFGTMNGDHSHNIPCFRLIQSENKFGSEKTSNRSKFIKEKGYYFKKSMSDEEIRLPRTNRKLDVSDERNISILDSNSPQNMKKSINSPKHNETHRESRENYDEFTNTYTVKFINCENPNHNIKSAKTKVTCECRKNEQLEKPLIKKGSLKKIILSSGWKDYKSSENKDDTIINEHDLQANDKPFDNPRLQLPHLKVPQMKKNKNNYFPEKKCICPQILIVDDDSFNILSMECLLKQLKYTYSSAFNGQLAIDQVIQRESNKCSPSCEQYKLILMDFSMPIMNGIEATKILKEKMKCGLIRPIRIIACTAFASIDKRKECIAAGMDDFISKPIELEKLRRVLDNLKK